MDGCVQKPKDFEFSNKKWFNWASSVDAGKGSTSDNEDYGKRAGWLRVKVASSVLSPIGQKVIFHLGLMLSGYFDNKRQKLSTKI